MRKLIVLLILVVGLAACQGETTQLPPPAILPTAISATAVAPAVKTTTPLPTPAATSKPVSEISVNAEDLRGVQVEFWHPWSGALAKELDAAVVEFNQSNIWGITVKAVSQGSILGLDDLVNNSLHGGALPQVIAMPAEYIASYQDATSEEVELDPYLVDLQWGLSSQEEADFFPAFWNESGGSGPRLSMPVMRSMAVLFYNQTWAKTLGFNNSPATPADFRTQVCKAGKANTATGDPDIIGTGGWILSTDSPTVYSWLAAYGAVPDQSPASDPQIYNTSNTVTAFNYLRKLSDDACAWVSRNPEPYNYFVGHQAIVYSGTLEDIPAQNAAMTYAKSSDEWTILPYPADGSQNSLITFGPSLAIFKSTPAKQLASWLFMRWMVLPRVQAELAAAGSLLPVRKSALDLMTDYAKNNPQWSLAAGWLNGSMIQPLPTQSWWKVTQRVLEDGAGQVFQPFLTANQIPDVLKELDATVQELLTRK